MSTFSASTQNPWFAVSMGLIGIIIGYAIGTANVSPGAARVAVDQPAAPSVPSAPTDVAAPAQNVPPVDPNADYIRGNKDARVTVVEYSDFECPFCKRHHPTLERVMQEYGNDVSWVYRHFPLTSIHPNAQKAAEASECAAEQGGNDVFWTYADGLMDAQQLSMDVYVQLAKDLRLDEAKFTDCVNSGKYAQKVSDQAAAGAAAGVQGTPANFIVVNADGTSQSVDGAVPYESIKSVLDAALQG